MSKCTRVIAIFLLLACLSQPVTWAQQAQEGPGIENFLDGANGGRGPVMQSVFWNTLYGSLWGATIGVSYHFLSGAAFRESISGSMTIGGLMGYGLGLYLVINGISFNQNLMPVLPKPNFGPPTDTQTQVQNEDPIDPLAFWAAPSEDGQSWHAGLQLRF